MGLYWFLCLSFQRRNFISHRKQGFTLIELLVALSIISILVGMGIYTLVQISSGSRLEATAASLRSLIRKAKNSAREEGETCGLFFLEHQRELWIIQPILGAYFHFEPKQIQGNQGVYQVQGGGEASPLGQGKGIQVVPGHLGGGVEFITPDSGIQFSSNPFFSPKYGFLINLWIFRKALPPNSKAFALSRRKKAKDQKFDVVQKDESYRLRLTGEGGVEIGLRGKNPEGILINHFVGTFPGIIPLQQWTYLELRFYRGDLQLFVDGIPRVLMPLKVADNSPTPPQELEINANPLLIGGGDFPVVLDQLGIYIFAESERLKIPKSYDLVIEGAFPIWKVPEKGKSINPNGKEIQGYQIFFNPKGELYSFYHSGPVRFLIGIPDRKKMKSSANGGRAHTVSRDKRKNQKEKAKNMVWKKVIPIAVDMGGNLLNQEESWKIIPGKGVLIQKETRKVK